MRTFARVFALTAVLMVPAFGNVVFNLNYEFSGAASPLGTAPWLTATFTDDGSGVVQLVLDAENLVGGEFVSEWYFNLDPNLKPSDLVITPAQNVVKGENAFKADGDGYFDFGFLFPQGSRFTGGTLTYQLSMAGVTLAASHFQFGSYGGAKGPLPTAAHVQGIGPNGDSGWISVPEASPSLFYGLLLGGLGWGVWRRRPA